MLAFRLVRAFTQKFIRFGLSQRCLYRVFPPPRKQARHTAARADQMPVISRVYNLLLEVVTPQTITTQDAAIIESVRRHLGVEDRCGVATLHRGVTARGCGRRRPVDHSALQHRRTQQHRREVVGLRDQRRSGRSLICRLEAVRQGDAHRHRVRLLPSRRCHHHTRFTGFQLLHAHMCTSLQHSCPPRMFAKKIPFPARRWFTPPTRRSNHHDPCRAFSRLLRRRPGSQPRLVAQHAPRRQAWRANPPGQRRVRQDRAARAAPDSQLNTRCRLVTGSRLSRQPLRLPNLGEQQASSSFLKKRTKKLLYLKSRLVNRSSSAIRDSETKCLLLISRERGLTLSRRNLSPSTTQKMATSQFKS